MFHERVFDGARAIDTYQQDLQQFGTLDLVMEQLFSSIRQGISHAAGSVWRGSGGQAGEAVIIPESGEQADDRRAI